MKGNDCYDFDSNVESHESTAQRPVQGESSKPTHLPEISFISTVSKPDPTPTSSSSTTKSLDTTAKQIVKPLYDLVNTANTMVTHIFAFSKYIFLKELTTNSDSILKEVVQKDFFVEVFLSLIFRTGRRSSDKVKNTTAKNLDG
ncbi:hypothetical protein G6F56_002806 [Rhizopus delemar]|nr:hypothetical protein G6F56_002806 [Rhizopus delemar]